MYKIIYSLRAEEDLRKLKKDEPAAFRKAVKLLNELTEHPKTGTGHPEQLKGSCRSMEPDYHEKTSFSLRDF